MGNKIKATAFEVLQKKLTIEDTLEFRENSNRTKTINQ